LTLFVSPIFIFGDGIGTIVSSDANRFIGMPYIYGGNSFTKGIDCSAFVKGLYAKHGFYLPRRAEWQVIGTRSCPTYSNLDEVQIGDSLYFRTNSGKGRIHHVALVTGFDIYGTPIITHAKGRKYGVVRETISNRYIKELTAIKRFSECSSVLKNKFSEEEMASVLLFVSKKYNIPSVKLFGVISGLTNMNPLVIFLNTDRELTSSLITSFVGDGVSASRVDGGKGVYLYIDNIFQAQYIASEFKHAGVPFSAGISLTPSSLFSKSDVSEMFYPLVNIEKSISRIKSCMNKYKDERQITACLIVN